MTFIFHPSTVRKLEDILTWEVFFKSVVRESMQHLSARSCRKKTRNKADALTFCCSFFACFEIFFDGATPIFADLKDSKRLLMVLWKISCTSFSSSLMPKWLRLYLCRCFKRERRRHFRNSCWGIFIPWDTNCNHFFSQSQPATDSPDSCSCRGAGPEGGESSGPQILSVLSWSARAFPDSPMAPGLVCREKTTSSAIYANVSWRRWRRSFLFLGPVFTWFRLWASPWDRPRVVFYSQNRLLCLLAVTRGQRLSWYEEFCFLFMWLWFLGGGTNRHLWKSLAEWLLSVSHVSRSF